MSQVTDHIGKVLPDAGDGLAAEMAESARDATPVRCELLAMNLEGARRTVLRLGEELRREEQRTNGQ